ncbi:MAG: DNA primase small subunit domain-containing protein [Candidatus Bathyarchaeia archaeon]
MTESMQRLDFLKQCFLAYYKEHLPTLQPPPSMKQREFGFLMFRDKIMVRHKSFNDFDSFKGTLLSLAPSDVYYSTAYYEKPDADMSHKGWLGSDIVFDVDADHIDAPCKGSHDMWSCPNCKETRRGKKPPKCPNCNHEKLEDRAWLCDRCLFAAKEEMVKLRDIMVEDFGISPNEVHLFFSGHRGYHMHLMSDKLMKLGDSQRKEIVDYVLALGLDPDDQGLYLDEADGSSDISSRAKSKMIIGPQTTDPGWRGRLAKGVIQIITGFDQGQLLDLGFSKGAVTQIINERETIEAEWLKRIPWSYFQDRWRVTEKIWKSVMEKSLDLVRMRTSIDTVVTTDIHRLIRMPGTLNGKTGLRATMLGLNQLEMFDPFDEPAVFQGSQKVYVKESPEIRIHDNRYGPFVNEQVELPLAAAVLLIAKGIAIPVS